MTGMTAEWAIFRKSDELGAAPFDYGRWTSQGDAERALRRIFIEQMHEFLEVRVRYISPFTRTGGSNA